MKKIVMPIVIVASLALLVFLIGKATYSLYKSNKEINVHSTSGNMVCNATITEDSEVSIYGYKKLKVTISNYEEVNNVETVSDVPVKYDFTLSGPTGTKFRVYDDTTNGRTIQNGQGFTNTNSIVIPGSNGYDSFSSAKTSKDYYFEVLTSTDGNAAQTKDYAVELRCAQDINPYSLGNLIYFDPTKADQSKCNNNDHTGNTCMKWRVISSDNNNVTLQLDHNLVNTVAWNTSGSNNDGPATVLTSLASATSGWTNVDPLTYTYNTSASAQNYGTLLCTSGSCTVNGSNTPIVTGLRARLITAEEVAAITKTQTSGGTIADSWTLGNQDWYYFSRNNKIIGTQDDGTGNTNLSWMIENTLSDSSSGASENSYGEDDYGYWTLTPGANNASYSFYVDCSGNIFAYTLNMSYGARPVITIPKTKIK